MTERKKLLIVLGSGSSLCVGLPSVRRIDDLMRGWASNQGVYDDERYQADFYRLAWQAIASHTAGSRVIDEDEGPNFEKTLGLMLALSNWVRPRPHGQPLRDLIGDESHDLPTFFGGCRLWDLSVASFGPSLAVTQSYVDLLIRLAAYVRDRSRVAQDSFSSEFATLCQIMQSLRNRFEVGILSLNYDDIALQAWPDAFFGFSSERDRDGCRYFDAAAVHQRRQWGFIYHLHGSVHHTLPAFGDPRSLFEDQIRWKDDLNGVFVDAVPNSSSILNQRSDGNDIPASTLVAGALKLDQLLGDPFQTLYAALQRHVHEADAILVVGYGFGDVHVNRLLLSRLTRRGPSAPPVMILEWTPDERPTMFNRNDGWPRRVRLALGVGPQSFHIIPGTVGGVKLRRWFETAGDRIAIWHNGFLEIEDRLEPVLDFLDGVPTALDGLRSVHAA